MQIFGFTGVQPGKNIFGNMKHKINTIEDLIVEVQVDLSRSKVTTKEYTTISGKLIEIKRLLNEMKNNS